jgi:hypothetical protein
MKITFLLTVCLAALGSAMAEPLPLTQSTFTEIIKDAKVVAASTKAATRAQTNEVVKAPDLVRTGPESRVELTAPDETITRIGANTVFSFEPTGRTILLEHGSILFHSPKGKGGGTISSGGASAAVLGTTLICAVLLDGAFKTIVLEGHGKVTLRNGKFILLDQGQMVIVLPGGDDFGPVEEINLKQLADHLLLLNGFSHPVSSWPLILVAIGEQEVRIADGTAGRFAPLFVAGNGLDFFDGNADWKFRETLGNDKDHTQTPLSPCHP